MTTAEIAIRALEQVWKASAPGPQERPQGPPEPRGARQDGEGGPTRVIECLPARVPTRWSALELAPGGTRQVRRKLRRTWLPFFARFGRTTAVQAMAIPPLLAGRSAVVCSPTATGKTEAVIAPLVERHLPAGTDRLGILYVVPTRALVNDLERRLSDPLRSLRLPLLCKTGDKPKLKKDPKGAILLTTPESLDSLLCRRPEIFCGLRAVVLDELHLCDGTYRGDQLRVLLRRLPSGLQQVALSATVDDPAALAERYLEDPDPAIVQVGGARPIQLLIAETPEQVVQALRRAKRHKALWFCNRRRDVEEVAFGLREHWPADRIAIHHGSLSRNERQSVEQAMREWQWGICVATMTLEIGIDIGDVDAVVLHGPPPTASAFQQRVGRACRREEEIFCVGLQTDPGDDEAFSALAELAHEGVVEPTDASPDLSVAVQQILSVLYANRAGIERDELEVLLSPLAAPAALGLILAHLVDEGLARAGRGRTLLPTTDLIDRGDKGTIHGNIPRSREHRFLDASTGRALGAALTSVSVGDTVVLAGGLRRVVSVRGSDVTLAPTTSAGGAVSAPTFGRRRSGGGWAWLLPEELRG